MKLKRAVASVFITFSLSAVGFIIVLSVVPMTARATVLYVGGIGPGNYTTIQGAINAVGPNDTVFVYSGFYSEHILITKSLALKGENVSATFIFWNDMYPTIRVDADWVNITGFTISNDYYGYAGVDVGRSNHCYIAGNRIRSDQGSGVWVGYSFNSTIVNNSFQGSVSGLTIYQSANILAHDNWFWTNDVGVYVFSSENVTLADNNVTQNNVHGIILNQSGNSTLSGNNLYTSGILNPTGDGISLQGELLEHWNTYEIDMSNTVNAKPVYYWKDVVGGAIPSGAGEVILANVTGVTVENQNLSDGDVGVELGFSTGNFLMNNTIESSNIAGVQLYFSTGNTILNNTFSSNDGNAVEIHESDRNLMSYNTMHNNSGYAVHLALSAGNVLYNNSVVGNGKAGIYGYAANGTVVSNNNVSSNAGQGIHLRRTERTLLSNNTIFSNSMVGIWVEDGDNSIVNNTVSMHSGNGIEVSGRGTSIASNRIEWNRITGIIIRYGQKMNVTNNIVSMNGQSLNGESGVTLSSSTDITVVNNTMVGNGVVLKGDRAVEWYSHIIDTSNRVNGKPLHYWKNATGGTIPSDAGQVIIANSNGVTVQDQNVSSGSREIQIGFSTGCTVVNNTAWKGQSGIFLHASNQNDITGNSVHSAMWVGAYLSGSSANEVSSNNISGNRAGFYVWNSNNNSLIDNTIATNTYDAISASSSDGNIIVNNTISGNWRGLYLSNSMGNLVHHNNFLGNRFQAYNNGTNDWDNGYPSGGNYWSDYSGPDDFSGPNQDMPGRDGIGDVPYPITGGTAQDRYPLRLPVGFPSPDLEVSPSNISFDPASPILQGTAVRINATIWNLGRDPSGSTVVRFYEGTPPFSQIGPDRPLRPLGIGEYANVSVAWTPLIPGSIKVCVEVDPENLVLEIYETNNIACKDMEVKYSRQVAPGHLFMSFPLAVFDNSIESVLSSIAGCYDYVRWYDSLDATSSWKSFVPARDTNGLLVLDNTMGFWINVTSTCTFTLAGTRPSSTVVSLRQGWNMVGFPSFNTIYTVADLKADLGLPGVIVETLDPSAVPYYLQRAADGYVMKTGEGYWVYVPSDTIWIVNG